MQKKFRAAGSLTAAAALTVLGILPGQATTAPATDRQGTEVYSTSLPDLGTVGGVAVKSSAYGSALAAKPGSQDTFYGLTDRGPNVDGPNGIKIEPFPDYAPQIGEFRMVDGKAQLQRVVELRGTDGKPYNGRVSTEADTGETIEDLSGKTLPKSDHGYDSEGLVALPDGTFWVSDEYGPYITHFDATGKQIGRYSPFDGTLPGELRLRDPNKGMEGLTVTPDGKTLVGIMQSALVTPDLKGKPKNVVPVRIVTVDLATGTAHQYLYQRHLDSADTNISEITALSDHEFLVDERDGDMSATSFKRLYKIDLTGATDVSEHSTVPGSSYDAAKGGLLVGGKSIEGLVGKADEGDAAKKLAAAGITPVSSQLYLDVTKLVWGIDPTGGYFAHDKIEGVTALNGGRDLWLSNDSDYGLDGSTGDHAPFGLKPKTLPDGSQDDGQFLHVDMDAIPAEAKGPGYVPAPTGTESSAAATPSASATSSPGASAATPSAAASSSAGEASGATGPTASDAGSGASQAPATEPSATTSGSAGASEQPVDSLPTVTTGAAGAAANTTTPAAQGSAGVDGRSDHVSATASSAVAVASNRDPGAAGAGTASTDQPAASSLASTGTRNTGLLALAGGLVLVIGAALVGASVRRRRQG